MNNPLNGMTGLRVQRNDEVTIYSIDTGTTLNEPDVWQVQGVVKIVTKRATRYTFDGRMVWGVEIVSPVTAKGADKKDVALLGKVIALPADHHLVTKRPRLILPQGMQAPPPRGRNRVVFEDD